MAESGRDDDSFGKTGPIRKPDAVNQGDGTSDDQNATSAGDGGEQNPASSGTTSIGGEPKDADSIRSPGGVEGTG